VGLLTGLVYGSIRGVTKLVGVGLDKSLAQLEPLLGERTPGPSREALQAALNGVLGDVLEQSGNPLAIPMQLRRGGVQLDPAALEGPGPHVVVLVHGSSMNDLQWLRQGHDHGAALERDLGVTAIYALYNSGLHVSTNGRALAELLEATLAAWPVKVKTLTLLGHSMGGLVSRAAIHLAEAEGLKWRKVLRALVTLGTPHHGAPLERGGAWAEFFMGLRAESAPLRTLAQVRSAGVTDLRFGSVRDEDWQGQDRFKLGRDARVPTPLPKGVACFAVAGSLAKSPRKKAPGDGLVQVDSALGRHEESPRVLAFPDANQLVAWGCSHLDLLNQPVVYEQVREWLRG
jgi:pimeloyl-ACP methyl ester carboxylesterase